jgi:NDP-4-keto-2,6-dideoxyhexose 3-C-methyltransferase
MLKELLQPLAVQNTYREILKCRICGNTNLVPVLDLGIQTLTGVFPKCADESVGAGPLVLVKCWDEWDSEVCGLVQLKHAFEADQLYGQNYGYRSGLNRSMVEHLETIASEVKKLVSLQPGDLVLDIGSNDGTLLRALDHPGVSMVGMDPSANKFRGYYHEEAHVIPDFFSSLRFQQEFGARRAKIVTSIAMFYDLDSPQDFVRQVSEILADDGVWFFEQSYLPSMLDSTSYDTVCHEHQEYFSLRPILWMLQREGLKVIDIGLNNTNGGSFFIVAAKATSARPENTSIVQGMLDRERRDGIDGLGVYLNLQERVSVHKNQLLSTLKSLREQGKKVFGYGASTKGNVTLQYCGITAHELPFIAEVNPDKFGCVTPGTNIPIISEKEARAMNPDVFLVLPWHFRQAIIEREAEFLAAGGRLLFPLPAIDLV